MGDALLDGVDRAVSDVIAPAARVVDSEGKFPREGVDALARAGVLGLTMGTDCGGGGADLRTACAVVERVARACGSTAMVLVMHYAACTVLDKHAPARVRRSIASGEHLSTIAFSEPGTRSHFWVSECRAARDGEHAVLDGPKSWITAAGEADSYVWSTLPADGAGTTTLWFVPAATPGLSEPPRFDGLGLRGNGSSPITASGVQVPAEHCLGTDGAGFEMAMGTVLPWFLTMSAAFSIGLMESVIEVTIRHLTSTRLEHLGVTLADQPLARSALGRIRVDIDRTRALLESAATAVDTRAPGAVVRPLEAKAAAAETAVEVTDRAMSVCGGAAFRKDLGIERRFRDARAARVMAPTTEALYEFIARMLCGLPMFEFRATA
jgi:alkylation response protein AidB-like acyl-CoA dehydrogenase